MSSPILQTDYILTDGTFSSEAYLEHHGIKGMKWGIRRFQNPDGTWTDEGKKRRQDETGSIVTKMGSDYFSPYSKAAHKEGTEEHKKAMEAADLGLKALKEHDRLDSFGDESQDLLRDWFLFEDQTIGMPTIANFINEGYSAKDCKEFIKLVNEKTSSSSSDEEFDDYYNKYGDIVNGYRLEEFADWCEETKKNTIKHSDNFSSEAYLMHHGIKGMKWGIRRFQNPDGTLTELGKKRYGTVENLNNRMTLNKKEKLERKAAADKAAADKAAAELDAAKRAAINSGDADRILALSGSMSMAELQEATTRLKTLDTIASYSKSNSENQQSEKKKRGETIRSAIDLGKSFATAMTEKYKAEAAKASRDKEKHQIKTKDLDLKIKQIESNDKAAKRASEDKARKDDIQLKKLEARNKKLDLKAAKLSERKEQRDREKETNKNNTVEKKAKKKEKGNKVSIYDRGVYLNKRVADLNKKEGQNNTGTKKAMKKASSTPINEAYDSALTKAARERFKRMGWG